jgi:RHS repeat-associated protein
MKKYLFAFSVITLGASLFPSRLAAQGDDNPTGVAGIYNGNITTAGSYDPFTHNTLRVVDDIVVPGSVGAYPLKWTRYYHSRNGYSNGGKYGWWGYSYGYSIDEAAAIAFFPDGRVDNWWDVDPAVEEYIGNWNVTQKAIFLADGGKAVFTNYPYLGHASWLPTQVFDPYGQITTISYDVNHRLSRITEPGGRYLLPVYDSNSGLIGVQAWDGQGNMTQSVTYTWADTLYGGAHPTLNRVDYSDGTFATYTYRKNDVHNGNDGPLLATADDVRYSGPMRQIKYQYPDPSAGVVTIEKNLITGEAVSTISNPTDSLNGPVYRTETRGDGPTRNFTYGGKSNGASTNATGKLINYTDFLGHTTWIDYGTSGNGFSTSVTDARGASDGDPSHTTIYTRGDPSVCIGNVCQFPWAIYRITHPDGSYIAQTFKDDGNPYYLASRTDELNHTTYYHRDDPANPNAITSKNYPDGGWETFTYNNFGEVLVHVRAKDASTTETESFRYDEWNQQHQRGLKTSYIDPLGNVTTYTYYTSGPWTDRLLTVTHPANVSGQIASETYQYDLAFVNGLGTGAPIAGRGAVTKITHADTTSVTNVYDIYGELMSASDELGHTTSHTYDVYKRVLTTTDPLGQVTTNSYIPTGKTSSTITTSALPFVTTLPSTKKTNFYYDGNWKKIRVQRAPSTSDEANSYFTYDPVGSMLTAKDPRNNTASYHYDIRNRQDWITDALGTSSGDPNHTTSFTFDFCGNKLTETHPKPDANTAGELITYDQYDAMNRLLQKTVHRDNNTPPTLDVTHTTYDLAGNLKTFTDEGGNVYTYGCDLMNRRTSVLYPPDSLPGNVQRSELSDYDGAGNLKTYTNRNGDVQNFTYTTSYDNRNRQCYFAWSDGTTSQTTSYDAASRVTQVVNTMTNSFGNATSTINHTFDDANQLLTEEEWTSAFNDNVHRTVADIPDADGNRLNVQYPSGTAFNYIYTNRNQVSIIKPGLSGGTAIVSYVYDASGNITSRALDNSTSTVYTVDTVNRNTAVAHTLVGTTRRFDYAYNNVNDITAVERDLGPGDGFRYDLTQQILEYQQNGAVNLGAGTVSNPTADTNLTFDGCGNRTSLNAVPMATPSHLNQPMDTGISHTVNGNLQTWNGWAYTYDVQNRLTHASNGTATADFYYDGKNRQIARSINGAITFSVWDDWELIEEYAAGNVRSAAYLQGAHGPIKSLIDNIYFYQDELGSTSHISSSAGALLEFYKYDLYGRPTYWNPSGPSGTQISVSAFGIRDLFSGERFVTEMGMYDLRNRYYLPDLGRFLQPDPIGFKGDGSNLYRYCGNDWANRSDPMGTGSDEVGNIRALPNPYVPPGAAQTIEQWQLQMCTYAPTAVTVAQQTQARGTGDLHVFFGYLGPMDKDTKERFDAAKASVPKDSEMGRAFDWAVNDPKHRVDIVRSSKLHDTEQNMFTQTETRGVINWNPFGARTTNDGRAQSPAIVLGHELCHAQRAALDIRGYMKDLYPARHYGNREEQRVITGPETEAAKALHQGVRTDGGGKMFSVTSVDSIGAN